MDVRLRALVDEDEPWLRAQRARVAEDDPYNWFGHRDWTRPAITADGGTLLVEAGGELAGDVGWRAVSYGQPPWSTAFEIGISLVPALRGRGVGTVAQRLLAGYLFEHTTVHRVQATTDVTNVAERKALEKAGFVREGVLRGAQWRGGAWHDLVTYSLLRGE